MNLSLLFVRPYNKRFDWDGLLIIFGIEVGILTALSILKRIVNRRVGRETTARYLGIFGILILTVYIALVLSQTWFLSSRNDVRQISLDLFWSYRTAMERETGLQIENSRILEQICLNILMFIPFGYLLAETFRCFAEKPWKVVIAGCLFSIVIEVGQYILHVGLCELDDVFNNTVGCVLGLLIWNIMKRASDRIVLSRQGPV